MISAVLVLIAFAVLGGGLAWVIQPKIFNSRFGVSWGRAKIALATLGAFFILFILAVVVAPPLPEDDSAELLDESPAAVIEDFDATEIESPVRAEVESVQVIELKTDFPVVEQAEDEPAPSTTPATVPSTLPEPTPEPKVEPLPAPDPTPTNFTCSSNVYNCGGMSHAQGQAIYDYCMAQVGRDVHDLDRDNDGVACE